ncbi:dTDP-4-dehydrorhamnose 3,5-epimerase [Phaeovulum sp.]|uniref:dTDP-4-dehydrorhamnose 3,5-epimerase n=1 Tax=Phaeovulum sp. TaxID=2934796 RepID=UPI0035630B53
MLQESTGLAGIRLLTPRRFADNRGWFSEVWSKRDLIAAGITCDFVQDNHSASDAPGTLRGLHYQRPPHAQAKLVRCTRGAIFDVAVDARIGSPSYGRWVGVELSAENGRQLFIPEGFLHGFVTREAASEVQYKCSAYYAPECDGAVHWDSLGIDWGLKGAPVLSPKDAGAPAFADWQSPFRFEGAA